MNMVRIVNGVRETVIVRILVSVHKSVSVRITDNVRKMVSVRNMNSAWKSADMAKVLEIETYDIILFQVY